MSILLAVISSTTLPSAPLPGAPVPPPVSQNLSAPVFLFCAGWAIAGLVVAWMLGAFRRNSIVGPTRLAPDESASDLLGIFLIAFFCAPAVGIVLLRLFHVAGTAASLLLQTGVDLATFIGVLVLLRRFRSMSFNRFGLDPHRLIRGIGGGCATLFVLYPLIQLTSAAVEFVYDHFHLTRAKPHELLQLLGDSQDRRLTTFAIVLAVVIAPCTEELMYRGLLQTILGRFFSTMSRVRNPGVSPAADAANAYARWAGVIVTSLFFAAIHVQPAFFAPLFVLAIGLGYVYERTGNLWMTITVHALFNLAQIMLYLAGTK